MDKWLNEFIVFAVLVICIVQMIVNPEADETASMLNTALGGLLGFAGRGMTNNRGGMNK